MPLDQFVPSLAALLELQWPEGRYPPLKMSAQELKRRINDDVAEWHIASSEHAPIAIVWEDMHWADPSSLDYAALMIEQLPTSLMARLDRMPHIREVAQLRAGVRADRLRHGVARRAARFA